jgi:hypothetical protein
MVQADWLEGSGAKKRPCGAASRVIHAFTQPASTNARRLRASMFSTWFIRVRAIITPPSTASTAPLRLVPAPRGMMGSFIRLHSFTMATTSSVERGKTTAVGKLFSNVYASHS